MNNINVFNSPFNVIIAKKGTKEYVECIKFDPSSFAIINVTAKEIYINDELTGTFNDDIINWIIAHEVSHWYLNHFNNTISNYQCEVEADIGAYWICNTYYPNSCKIIEEHFMYRHNITLSQALTTFTEIEEFITKKITNEI